MTTPIILSIREKAWSMINTLSQSLLFGPVMLPVAGAMFIVDASLLRLTPMKELLFYTSVS